MNIYKGEGEDMDNQAFDLAAFRLERDAERRLFMQWQPPAADVIAAYSAGERDFSKAYLRGANLEGANLEGAYLRGANLEGAYLRGANLEGAYLRGANLEGANLRGANLEGANLEGANLEGANLEGAYLRGANLEGANLRGANLEGANLEGANLEGANLEGAYLRGANLRGANLINTHSLYCAVAPGLSSRGDSLYAHLTLVDGGITLCFNAGCQHGLTAQELRERVRETHGNNSHAQQYEAAIIFIEACFAADMDAKRWDYLKNWNSSE